MTFQRSLALVAVASFGALLGAVAMYLFSANLMSYGNAARFVADATTDITVLEELSANRIDDARAVLRARLQGSLEVLRSDPDHQTAEQRAAVRALEKRAEIVLAN